jgi:drug/metabolite transporter (DMT)-like permease
MTPVPSPEKSPHHIPLSGMALLLLVSLIWGGNMVSIKVSNQGVPPILAATLRSVVASLLLWAFAMLRREPVLFSRADLGHAFAIGTFFGLDFLFLYWGPAFTDASRAVIFLYTHPFWVLVAAHLILPDDRLSLTKVVGLVLAFLGMITVFGSRSATLGPHYWVGDLMEVAAAMFWAANTIYIKWFSRSRKVNHVQTLFAQLCFSIPVLLLGACIFEWGSEVSFTVPTLAALGYQTIIVAFFSYLLWFWMIHRYPVSLLSAFTFLSPMFGVVLSGLYLKESIAGMLLVGLGCVASGIYLVNRPRPGV